MKKVFQLKFAHSLLLVFFCALLSPVFTSCGGDDEPDDPTDFLIGTWRVQGAEEYGYIQDYTFTKDGKITLIVSEGCDALTNEASYIHYPEECQIKIFTPEGEIFFWTYEKISDTRIAVLPEGDSEFLVLHKL